MVIAFPVRQDSINSASWIRWTKTLNASGTISMYTVNLTKEKVLRVKVSTICCERRYKSKSLNLISKFYVMIQLPVCIRDLVS